MSHEKEMPDTHGTYVEKVRQGTHQYPQDMLAENEKLGHVIAEMDAEGRRLADRFVQIEQQNSNLGNLDVASYRLHCTLDRSGAGPEEAHLTACVPLKLESRIFGAIALFRLLAQRSGCEPLDHELFYLLASHAATALYATRLHRRATQMRTSRLPPRIRRDGRRAGATGLRRSDGH